MAKIVEMEQKVLGPMTEFQRHERDGGQKPIKLIVKTIMIVKIRSHGNCCNAS